MWRRRKRREGGEEEEEGYYNFKCMLELLPGNYFIVWTIFGCLGNTKKRQRWGKRKIKAMCVRKLFLPWWPGRRDAPILRALPRSAV